MSPAEHVYYSTISKKVRNAGSVTLATLTGSSAAIRLVIAVSSNLINVATESDLFREVRRGRGVRNNAGGEITRGPHSLDLCGTGVAVLAARDFVLKHEGVPEGSCVGHLGVQFDAARPRDPPCRNLQRHESNGARHAFQPASRQRTWTCQFSCNVRCRSVTATPRAPLSAQRAAYRVGGRDIIFIRILTNSASCRKGDGQTRHALPHLAQPFCGNAVCVAPVKQGDNFIFKQARTGLSASAASHAGSLSCSRPSPRAQPTWGV